MVEPDRRDFHSETQFDRWVQDPAGIWFHIQGLKTVGVSGPILLGTDDAGPGGNALLRAINAILARLQRPGTTERCQLTVFRVGKKHKRPVWGSLSEWQEGQMEADNLAAEIAAGTLDLRFRFDCT